MTPFQERLGRFTVQWMTGLNIVAYRLSEGRVAGRVGSAPLCLLTTTGRRSGRPRTVPLLHLRDGDNYVVAASRGGMSTHPAWYLNLRANPAAIVRTGSKVERVTGQDATAEERERLWPALSAVYPHFSSYQMRTSRLIPVVVLRPA
jgi:F420H(2)-dependent quinone reductase